MIEAQILENHKIMVLKNAVSDSVKYETIRFTFPKSWKNYVKTATFKTEDATVSVVLQEGNLLCISENECYIPHEVLTFPGFSVSVFGNEGDTLATTANGFVAVIKSGYEKGVAPKDPTPDEYAQIIGLVNETKSVAQSVRDDADNGLFNGEKGEKGDKGDTGPQGPRGEKGDKGEKGQDGTIINLDQTYNPESENAQSGIAVAEALQPIHNITENHIGKFNVEYGWIRDDNGKDEYNKKRVKTGFIKVNANTIIGLTSYSNVEFVPYVYDENKNFIRRILGVPLVANYVVPTEYDNCYIRIVISNSDNSEITQPDVLKNLLFFETPISTKVTLLEQQMESVIQNNRDIIGDILPLDASKWVNGSLRSDNGLVFNEGLKYRLATPDIIPIDSTKTYTVRVTNPEYMIAVYSFADGNFVKYSSDITADKTEISFTNNVNGVRFLISHNPDGNTYTLKPEEIASYGLMVCENKVSYDEQINAIIRNTHKDKIVLMTHNVGLFDNGGQNSKGTYRCPDEKIEERKEMFKRLIARYEPDIIFTQESPLYMNESNTVLGEEVYSYRYENYGGSHEPANYAGYMGRHIATNYPLIALSEINITGQRSYVKAYTYINGIKVALYDVHFGLTAENRAVEIQALLNDLENEKYFIVGGDTNAEMNELAPLVNAGYIVANKGEFATDYWGGHIDNFILSNNMKIVYTQMDSEIFSSMKDHNPLICTITVGNTANEPTVPKNDGIYTLKATIQNGIITYNWVAEST